MTEARAAALAALDAAWNPERVTALLDEMAHLAERAIVHGRGGRLEVVVILHSGKAAEVWCGGIRVA